MPLPSDPTGPDGSPPKPPRSAAPAEFDLFPGELPPRRPSVRAARSEPAPEPKPPAAAPIPPAPAEAEKELVIPGPPRPAPGSKAPLSSTPSTSTGTRNMAIPPNLDDFRRNTERQSREQKSFGNVLATITYSILVAFILVTALAGYGGWVLFKRVRLQGMTIVDLDKRYEAEVLDLKEDLSRTHANIQRLTDDAARQQEQISRLRTVADKLTSDLAAEKAARAQSDAAFTARLDQSGIRR